MRTKLLLADDSITIQKVVGIIFASEDYELTIVDNGNDALEKAREVMPDVLLVDAVMPGKTGYEVCEDIRRDPALKEIPILLLTGAFEPFDEGKARQSGADDFISKPFESQHLIDKVLGLVDLGRQRATAAPAPAVFAQVPPPAMESPVQPPPIPQPAQTAAAPAPQASAESFDFFAVSEGTAQGVAPAAVAKENPEFELEIVEGSAEDDLWGAFELEDVAEGEAVEFQESPFEAELLAAGTQEAEEPFVFAEQEEALAPNAFAEPAGFAPQWESGEETGFSFGKEAEPTPFEISPEEEFAAIEEQMAPRFETGPDEAEEFFVETVEPAAPEIAEAKAYAPPAEMEFDLQFAPEEEYVPAPEALAPAAPAMAPARQEIDIQFAPEEEYVPAPEALAPAAPATAPARQEIDIQFAPEEEYMPAAEALTAPVRPPAAGVALGEDQLAALVARISKDIIEKIAWEVVPDLAERIINEEIRKIKAGV